MKVAVLVGHNSSKQGATNYLMESEFSFNQRIARKLILKLLDRGVGCKAFYRAKSASFLNEMNRTADNIFQWNRAKDTIVLELHFNAARNPKAKGCEVLCLENDNNSFSLADLITDNLKKDFGIFERYGNGVNSLLMGSRGYNNLTAMQGAHAKVIVEPCFGGWRNHESKQIFENEDRYVTVLAKSLSEFIRMNDERTREAKGLIEEIAGVPGNVS